MLKDLLLLMLFPPIMREVLQAFPLCCPVGCLGNTLRSGRGSRDWPAWHPEMELVARAMGRLSSEGAMDRVTPSTMPITE